MKKKIKLTKEQKQMIDEITVTADTGATNGNITQAVQNAGTSASSIVPTYILYTRLSIDLSSL